MTHKDYTIRFYDNGIIEHMQDGKLHREDGPAIETSAGKEWYVNGKLHREDGPAIEYNDGTKQWWLNGEQLTEAEHAKGLPEEVKLYEDFAIRVYDDGHEEWFIDGIKIEETEYNTKIGEKE